MDASKLKDRLRAVVGAGGARATLTDPPRIDAPPRGENHVAETLGGEWQSTADGGRCFVIERRLEPATRHGRQSIARFADDLRAASDAAAVINPGAAVRPPFLFFDLETTGLSGGAGTYPFLVGCGWFDEDATFIVRQYLLARMSDERAILGSFASVLSSSGALVSFNGKTFDAPVLETRCLYHRLAWCGASHPHLDVLHPARRLWSARSETNASGLQDAGCSLAALEREILGAWRVNDVAGVEIPGRYFQFLRSGDARPLAAVLEHNRRDLLSLAGVTARIFTLISHGSEAARDAAEALALGRIYARAGDDGRAALAYQQAARDAAGAVRVEALRLLALHARRRRRYDEAARHWREVLDDPECSRQAAREATEALAIHHEHRVRDLAEARRFALLSLDGSGRPAWADAVRHRLARIDRKLDRNARLDL